MIPPVIPPVIPPAIPLAERAVGAYLGLAVGDALGATVEFMTPSEIREHHGVHRNILGGGWLRLRKGQITDDTEMSLALGHSILAKGKVEPQAVAEAFSAWMRGKPVDIGHTVRRGIARYRQTGEVVVPPNTYDAGNGACMRCLPVALCTLGAGPDEVAAANRAQSHVTHHSPLGDAGTLTVILMVQTALTGGRLADLQTMAEALAEAEPEYRYDRRRAENPGGYLPETLRAVFQALFANRGVRDGHDRRGQPRRRRRHHRRHPRHDRRGPVGPARDPSPLAPCPRPQGRPPMHRAGQVPDRPVTPHSWAPGCALLARRFLNPRLADIVIGLPWWPSRPKPATLRLSAAP